MTKLSTNTRHLIRTPSSRHITFLNEVRLSIYLRVPVVAQLPDPLVRPQSALC